MLPTVIIAPGEALRSVPPSIRDGAYALGATQWQVTWRQVLPAAIPGIATGSILALSRASGRPRHCLVGAVAYVRFDPTPDERVHRAPGPDHNWIKQPQDEFKLLAAAGIVVLLVMLLVLNSAAILAEPLPETMVRWRR